jgi:hypothetical protein
MLSFCKFIDFCYWPNQFGIFLRTIMLVLLPLRKWKQREGGLWWGRDRVWEGDHSWLWFIYIGDGWAFGLGLDFCQRGEIRGSEKTLFTTGSISHYVHLHTKRVVKIYHKRVLRASPRDPHILFLRIWSLPTSKLVWWEKKKLSPRVFYIFILIFFSVFFLWPGLMFYIRNSEFVSVHV